MASERLVGMCEDLWDKPQAIVEEGIHLRSAPLSIWLTTNILTLP